MSFISLCIGLFLFSVGVLRLIQAVWFQGRYIQKWGQVVGFSEEVRGLFAVVLRFQGMNGKEYFLVDREKSACPRYVMGEFIPILVSLKSAKHCLLYAATSMTQALSQIILGTLVLTGYFLFFKFTKADLYMALAFGVLIYALVTLFPKNTFIQKLRNLKISNFLSQMREPLVLEIEQSKLIKWTQNFAGVFPDEKTLFNVQRKLAQFLKPLFLLGSAVSMVLAIKSYFEVKSILNNSIKAGAVYDGRVKRSVYHENLKLDVPVFRYYGPKKQIYAAVDIQTPIIYNLKPGQKLIALVPKDQKLPVRLDRGWLNFWKTFLLVALSFFFMSMRGKASRKLEVKKKKSVIFLRKVS